MAKRRTESTRGPQPLPADEQRRLDAYWRACNYLAVSMIYLQDTPLLRESLQPEHVKNRLLGHWGASPGLSFTYVHLNRLIRNVKREIIERADLITEMVDRKHYYGKGVPARKGIEI